MYVLIQPVNRKEFEKRVFPNTYTYMVYRDGSSYYAKDGKTGAIEYVSEDASTVIQNLVNKISNGGIIVFKPGTYDIKSEITIPSTADRLIIDGNFATFNLYSNFLNFDNGSLPIRAIVKNMVISMKTDNLTAIKVFNRRSEFSNIHVEPITGGSVVIDIKRVYNTLFSNIWGYVSSGTGYVIRYINTTTSGGEGSSVFINCGVTSSSSAKGYAAYLVGNSPDYYVQYMTFINPFAYGNNDEFYMSNYIQSITIINAELRNLRIGGYQRNITVVGGLVSNSYICTDDVGACNDDIPIVFDNVNLTRSVTVGTGKVKYRNSTVMGSPVGISEKGIGVISANTTSTTINHGLKKAPSIVLITPINYPSGKLWVANITATSFEVRTDVAPSTDQLFSWYAEI